MACLKAKRVPQREVARATGVPFGTLTKIAQGINKNPSVHTVQRLADYFQDKAANDAPMERVEGWPA